MILFILFFFSSRRRHTRLTCDWSSDVCSSDLALTCLASGLVMPRSLPCFPVRGCAPSPGRPCSTPLHGRSEEHTSELQSHVNLVCRLLLEKKKKQIRKIVKPINRTCEISYYNV